MRQKHKQHRSAVHGLDSQGSLSQDQTTKEAGGYSSVEVNVEGNYGAAIDAKHPAYCAPEGGKYTVHQRYDLPSFQRLL